MRKARLEKNLYIHELAKLAGMTPQGVANIERNVYESKTGLKVAAAKPIFDYVYVGRRLT
ncbi:helix-turn-helix domain-containing protein [Caldalkalibacillus uzonensis]|uniref:helix-turn-helix domain-containing protein n=1 Tax=Caldalkalibacillus uzonensis TaxID=353224 RepID=UPI0027D84086|nr:helix-turn-helix transcriptional regulator [Caldalkalibacillus uzonensis]